jgi:ABC-type dipeptide/oligopeptide/nickel transport system permease component
VFGATLIIIIVCSIPLGVYSAIHPKSIFTKIVMVGSSIGISIPVFLTAIMLMYVFSIELGWLPSYGRGDTAKLPERQSRHVQLYRVYAVLGDGVGGTKSPRIMFRHILPNCLVTHSGYLYRTGGKCHHV